jgi:hypothetical protein
MASEAGPKEANPRENSAGAVTKRASRQLNQIEVEVGGGSVLPCQPQWEAWGPVGQAQPHGIRSKAVGVRRTKVTEWAPCRDTKETTDQ